MSKDNEKTHTAQGEQSADAQQSSSDYINNFDKLEAQVFESFSFRFNVVTRSVEIEKDGAFYPIDKRELNSIARHLRLERNNTFVSVDKLKEIIISDATQDVNPICEYFENLRYDGEDWITPLAQSLIPVREEDRDLFATYLPMWLTAVVANAFEDHRCANHLVLTLTGEQGGGKSTWVARLLPDELKAYYAEGRIDPENKDDLIRCSRVLINNLDDYLDSIAAKKASEFKDFITRNEIVIRKVWGESDERFPKRCSFTACSNKAQFLHDDTGSRRFLVFEIEGVDFKALNAVDINQVWAQAYHLYKAGSRYWLTPEEIAKMQARNSRFEVIPTEYECLVEYFEPCEDDNAQWAQISMIIAYLQGKGFSRLSNVRMGQALQKAGFVQRVKKINGKTQRVYGVKYL